MNSISSVLFPHAEEDLNNLYKVLTSTKIKYNIKMIGLIIYCYKDNQLQYLISPLTKKGNFIISKPDDETLINSESEIIRILTCS